MESTSRSYIAIDLKSFYASVECVERGLDPLDTHLVVADSSRTPKTICLAVSPALKALGTGGRPRLFEVEQRVRDVNTQRRWHSPTRRLDGKSCSAAQLSGRPEMEVGYIVAPPRMALYIEYSTRIYKIYLKYVSPDDIHVYSIDEVFIDVTSYLKAARMTPHQMAMTMIRDVLAQTGITATAGIGTNMYLAKIAMDIVAKKMPADADGVRIAELDEASYRRTLWSHKPLTDFWRVGAGTLKRLAPYGINTMGDIARASLQHEELLYKLLGVNAELLIDHAWGWEPATIAQVKAYKPETNSISSGQVLTQPYTTPKTKVVVMEMAQGLALQLLDKGLVTDQLVLTIGYDVECLKNPAISSLYSGPVVTDRYGRPTPKHAHGTIHLPRPTSSARIITEAVVELFERIFNPLLLSRRITLAACRVVTEQSVAKPDEPMQLDLFTDYEALAREQEAEQQALDKERRLMQATLQLKKRFGNNALLKGLDFDEGATARERNKQIGGHKA